MIDHHKIAGVLDINEVANIVDEEISKYTADDPPYLSDLLVNQKAWPYLQGIERHTKRNWHPGGKPFQFRLLCLYDEWGNVPQPGDIITRTIDINRKDANMYPVSSHEINTAKRNGSYDRLYVEKHEYMVDEKGCIIVGYDDAGYFLQNWGIHGRTKYAITKHRELSEEPVRTPDGGHLHVWYWRFAEQSKDMYAKLPHRASSDTDARGKKR